MTSQAPAARGAAVLAVATAISAACSPSYPRFPQPPPCGTTERDRAIIALPPSSLVLSADDGALVCIPGEGDECDEAEAACAVDLGDVPLGADTLFPLGMNAAPAGGSVQVTSIGFDGACAAAWYTPGSFEENGGVFVPDSVTLTSLRLRPLAAGDCDADVVVFADAGNIPDVNGARMHLHAHVVDDGGGGGGCRTDGACCCSVGEAVADALVCDEDTARLGCGGNGVLFFDDECARACGP